MRIVIATGPFFSVPPAPSGAVQRFWHDLAGHFTLHGHDVTIVCRGHPNLSHRAGNVAVRYVYHHAWDQTGIIGVDLFKDLLYALRMQSLWPAADVYVLNSFWLPVFSPFLTSRRARVIAHLARMPKGQVRLYRHAHRLAVVSQALKEAIAVQCPSALDRTRVIPYAIHTDVFLPPAVPRQRRPTRVIAYTGRVHPEKGIHVLLDAFRRVHSTHPSTHLRIIGPSAANEGGGGEAYLTKLHEQAGHVPVEFLPSINDRPGLARALHAADIYCYPSLAEAGETFGIAPLEAMGTGLPAVVSDLACFRDYVVPHHNALVFDHRAADPATELANALGSLLDNPALCQSLGEAAAVKAQDFSYDAVAAAYLSDFKELLADQ
jgi:glycosyltransferase involved in cell wall biosynthesis